MVLATCLAPFIASAQAASAPPVTGPGAPGPGAFYLAVELGRSDPWPVPGRWVRFSLAGQPPSPPESGHLFRRRTSQLRHTRLAGLNIGHSVGQAGPIAARMGVGFTRRAGYAQGFSTVFVTSKQTDDGAVEVSAHGAANGHTEVASDTLMVTLQVAAQGAASKFMGVYPWASAGVGSSRTVVGAQTAALNLSLQLRGPGFTVDSRADRGEMQIAAQAFRSLAWQIEAGLGVNLAPDRWLGLACRYVHLGRYRLISETSEWRVESQGEALRLVFAADRIRLSSREVTVSFRQAF
jgi:hypothetical protein